MVVAAGAGHCWGAGQTGQAAQTTGAGSWTAAQDANSAQAKAKADRGNRRIWLLGMVWLKCRGFQTTRVYRLDERPDPATGQFSIPC